jgi:mono/diheme cytochrome c family protein
MKILIALTGTALMFAVTVVAGQSAGSGEPRGELLYSTYCIGCHTTQVHWREKRLATDWTSLKLQIHRWQQNVAPGLGQDDADAIARYLNGLYYHFPATDTKQSDAAHESWRVTSQAVGARRWVAHRSPAA